MHFTGIRTPSRIYGINHDDPTRRTRRRGSADQPSRHARGSVGRRPVKQVDELLERIANRDEGLAELTAFKVLTISRLAVMYEHRQASAECH